MVEDTGVLSGKVAEHRLQTFSKQAVTESVKILLQRVEESERVCVFTP